MKIKKYLLNIVSIVLLLIIMVALIVALKNINAESNLNIGGTNTTSTKPAFEYVEAKKSNLKQINFENNFGGSGNDEILKVFNLNNHIIVGKTTSDDFYFENKKSGLFVAIVDFGGNLKNLVVAEEDNFDFVCAIYFNNSIYILINSPTLKLYEFNLIKQTLQLTLSDDYIGNLIVTAKNPILIYSNQTSSFAKNLATTKVSVFSGIISNIVDVFELGDEAVVVYNTNFSFKIASIGSEFRLIKNFENCNALNLNQSKTNYTFLIKTKTQTEFLILDKSFNVCGNVATVVCEKNKIFNLGSYSTMLYLNNNTLTSLEFCSHGDELIKTKVCDNILDFYAVCVNDEIYVTAIQKTQINFYKISNHNTITPLEHLINVSGLKITDLAFINSNLTIFGNVNQINSVITNCFGKSDVFVFEFALQQKI